MKQVYIQPSTLSIVYGVMKLDGSRAWIKIDSSPSGFFRGYPNFNNPQCPDSDGDKIFVPMDPITAIMLGIVSASELGVNESVKATLDLLTKGQ